MANVVTRWKKEEPPHSLLTIDPGASWPNASIKHPYAGCALFLEGLLFWVALVKCPVVDTTRWKPTGRVPAFAMPNVLVRTVMQEAMLARSVAETLWVAPGTKKSHWEQVTALAVEKPMLYIHGDARPNDIMNLRTIYGAFIGGIDAEFYSGPEPSLWKGSIDPLTLNERVVAILNASERHVLVQAQREGKNGLSDHVIDAVGIGLFTLGRAGTAMEI